MDDGANIIELIRYAQLGDTHARDRIVANNLNLVRSLVQRFIHRDYEWDDLFQIGSIGLIKAIDRFDESFNVKFSTYAVPMIVGEIRRFLRDDSPIKVSRPLKELASKVYIAQEKLVIKLQREPTITEIAQEIGSIPQDVVLALEAVQQPTSLYASAFHDNADLLVVDQIASCNDTDDTYLNNLTLRESLFQLPIKEREVIKMRFFEDKTQAEVALHMGISQVQVSRIERYALKLIRDFLKTS